MVDLAIGLMDEVAQLFVLGRVHALRRLAGPFLEVVLGGPGQALYFLVLFVINHLL